MPLLETGIYRHIHKMRIKPKFYYAIYGIDDDTLLCIGSARECADYMGISTESFRSSISHALHRGNVTQAGGYVLPVRQLVIYKYKEEQ